MNIFVLDRDPVKAAEYHCNTHVVKMVLETAQILSTVVKKYYPEAEELYRATHKNHPCVLWAGETKENFRWLYYLGMALCEQYELRYNKIHKSKDVIGIAGDYDLVIPMGELTEFVQCVPDDVKGADPVVAYRSYYRKYKTKLLQWKSGVPCWVNNLDFSLCDKDLDYEGQDPDYRED